MDVTAGSGETAILYWGRLRSVGLSIVWSSALSVGPDEAPSSRSSLARVPEPAAVDDGIRWRHRALHVEAAWRPTAPRFARTLLETPRGTIEWTCIAPAAEASVIVDGRTVTGLGYVERIEMNIAPWRLPIETLEWGRALGDGRSLVWIRWHGPCPLVLALIDGQRSSLVALDEGGVQAGEVVVDLARVRVIRDAPLGESVLRTIPLPRRLQPASLSAMHESKWLSRAEFRSAAGPTDGAPIRGWAIHERVRFAESRPA